MDNKIAYIEYKLSDILTKFMSINKWNKSHPRYSIETLISQVNCGAVKLTPEEYEIYAAIKTLYNIAKE